MIDPRTTDIVGTRVRVVRRSDDAALLARGVVRVVLDEWTEVLVDSTGESSS